MEDLYERFMEKGIDDIYCMCVNDAFVMNAWGKELGIEKVKWFPMVTESSLKGWIC